MLGRNGSHNNLRAGIPPKPAKDASFKMVPQQNINNIPAYPRPASHNKINKVNINQNINPFFPQYKHY